MDNEEKKRKFMKIIKKYSIEDLKYFEKEEHIFRTVHTFAISNLMICMSLVIIGIIFSLLWLMFVALVLGLIGFIVLTINIIRDYMCGNKRKKKQKEFLEEIEKLKKI